jgi:hypothetical protein
MVLVIVTLKNNLNNDRCHFATTNTQDKREKIQALSLAKECYSMKLELLTNASVVDDAIRFVSSRNGDIKEIESKEDKNIIGCDHNEASTTTTNPC